MRGKGGRKYNFISKPKSNFLGEDVLRKLDPSEPVVSANAAPSARKARTKTSAKAPGARAAKHSKAVIEEPVSAPSLDAPVEPVSAMPEETVVAVAAVETVVEPISVEQPVAKATLNAVPQEEIAKLAFCYWMDRGCQGGDAHEDWVRAEQTLLAKAAV